MEVKFYWEDFTLIVAVGGLYWEDFTLIVAEGGLYWEDFILIVAVLYLDSGSDFSQFVLPPFVSLLIAES